MPEPPEAPSHIALEALADEPAADAPRPLSVLEVADPETPDAPARRKVGAAWRKPHDDSAESAALATRIIAALLADAPLLSALWPERDPFSLLMLERPTPALFAQRWAEVLTWLDAAARRDHETRARVEVAQLTLQRHRKRLAPENAPLEQLCAPALAELERAMGAQPAPPSLAPPAAFAPLVLEPTAPPRWPQWLAPLAVTAMLLSVGAGALSRLRKPAAWVLERGPVVLRTPSPTPPPPQPEVVEPPPPPPAGPLPPLHLPASVLLRPEGRTLTPYYVRASSLWSRDRVFNPPEYAFDGSLLTAWNDTVVPGSIAPWLEARFDVPQRFRTVRLTTGFEAHGATSSDLFTDHAHLRHLVVTLDGRPLRELDVPVDEHAVVLYDLDAVGSVLRLTAASVWPGAHTPELALSEVVLEGEPAPDDAAPARGTEAEVESAVDAWLRAQNQGELAAWSALYAPDFHGARRSSEGGVRYVSRASWLAERGELFAQPQQVRALHRRVHWAGEHALAEFDLYWSNAERAERGTKTLRFVRTPEGLHIVFEELAGARPWDRVVPEE